MPRPESKRVNRDQYDAVLFDLDGVITNTATLHAMCWKQMFDEYLQGACGQREAKHSAPSISPRTTGSTWMESPVSTAFVTFSDHAISTSLREALTTPADVETVHGLGNRKNDLVNRVIAEAGVEPYDGTVQFIHQAPPWRVQNCRRHLQSKLRCCLKGRQGR